MATGLYLRQAGAYVLKDYDDLYIKINGVWVIPLGLYVKVAGGYVNVWAANGPPPAPSAVNVTAMNGGKMFVTWNWPVNPEGDYLRAEVETTSGTGLQNTPWPTQSQDRLGYAHGASVALRVRTVDTQGLASAWVNGPVRTAIDVDPGPATTHSIVYIMGSGFRVNWTDAANPYSDMLSTQIWRRLVGGSYTLSHTEPYTGGAHSVIIPGIAWDAEHQFLIRTLNSTGYRDVTYSSVWAPPQAGTVKLVYANLGDTWAYGQAAWRNDGSVRAGQFSPTPMGINFGLFFYGNKLIDATHGYTPVKAEIFMVRDGGQGFSGNVRFVSHGYGTRPAGQPAGVTPAWDSASSFVGEDASAWEDMPSGARTALASGTAKGFGIYQLSTAQSEYRHFRSPSTNGNAGLIRLTF